MVRQLAAQEGFDRFGRQTVRVAVVCHDILCKRSMTRDVSAFIQSGKAAWPQLEISDDEFASFISARPTARFERAADLYLVCACLAKKGTAPAELDTRYLSVLDGALQKAGATPEIVDEVKQTLRHRLLTGPTPELAAYRGEGDLNGWLRIMAVREAVKLLQRARRNLSLSRAVEEADDDPELQYFKLHYQAAFKEALSKACADLSARQRTLLRMQFVDQLRLDQIASVYRVHRATVVRWLAETKEQLLRETRKSLTSSLGIAADELDSIVRIAASRFELTLSQALQR
jgi:RNA polymerase sigma-70 factor (ECF subfamily)